MTTNIPEWAMIALVGVILAVMGWGIRRLVEGQDTVMKELGVVSNSVTKICGHVDMANSRAEQDRSVCDERHSLNISEHERMLDVIEKLRS